MSYPPAAATARFDGVPRLVDKTHQHCIVTNALSVPVEVRATATNTPSSTRVWK